MQKISGADAIYRMRNLRLVNDASFTIIHISCNLKTGECGEIIKHDRCRLRNSPDARSSVNSDHYLPYEDLDTGEP
ncbi:MAG: hypothetical protein LBK58_14590, partial [Prevotellaceae bacterium]|nr:hypothetical protein [Prevotellaceae bacterium]